jgi:pyridoxine 4-dehydrogenase
MGTGAWAWGDSLFWGYNPAEDASLEEVFNLAVSSGNGFFDTAELYGLGRSESLLSTFAGRLPPGQREGVSVATKFAPLPWKTTRGDVVRAAEASVARLGGRPVDLYQIHFPNSYANEAYWDGLGDCYDRGLIRSCGVSNYGADAVVAVHENLRKRGIPLSS